MCKFPQDTKLQHYFADTYMHCKVFKKSIDRSKINTFTDVNTMFACSDLSSKVLRLSKKTVVSLIPLLTNEHIAALAKGIEVQSSNVAQVKFTCLLEMGEPKARPNSRT